MSDFISGELKKYNMSDAAIAKMEEIFMPLVISGLDDKKGYAAVKSARLEVKGKRVDVEKVRKSLKKDSLAFGRAVDGEAKRLTALLKPIEEHLTKEQETFDREVEEMKKEKAAREALPERLKVLEELGLAIPEKELLVMTDEEFLFAYLKLQKIEVQEKAARLKAEQENLEVKKAAEAVRIRAERERIEAEKRAAAKIVEDKRIAEDARIRAAREKIEVEKRIVEDEKRRILEVEEARKMARIEAEKQRVEDEKRVAAEMARAKKTAGEEKERALAEQRAQVERESAEKKLQEQREREEAERQERLKPDREKLLAYADKIAAMPMPEVSAESRLICEAICVRVGALLSFIRREVKNASS